MEKREELFCLTEKDLMDLRYIKLDKKASYGETYFQSENSRFEDREGKYEQIQFYTCGFYDVLTCIKMQMATSQAHKKHFLISDFTKKTATLRVEQWFGIFPLAERGKYFSETVGEDGAEPFFCSEELQSKHPFLGIILVSLENTSENFKGLLADYIVNIQKIFDGFKKKSNFIAETYYSLNCVDLCLAIRTDSLPFIHKINYELNNISVNGRRVANTTVIFAVQNITKLKVSLMENVNKNKEVSFIVRSDSKCEMSGVTSYGVNGTGRYVTQFTYEQYMELMPDLVCYKLEKDGSSKVNKNSFVRQICHEREWFIEESCKKNLFDAQENSDIFQRAICRWFEDVYGKLSEIEKIAEDYFIYKRRQYNNKEKFTREFRLLRDLVGTYSDLWYQSASESGFAFFMQLWIALCGIKIMLDKITEIEEYDDDLEASIEYWFRNMHDIVCDLNAYNKQFQLLNHDSVNFPVYEIRSKVNAEKYMSAYCAFLHKFFVLYYTGKAETENIVQGFPLALVDLRQRKIEANIYFRALYMKERTKQDNIHTRSMFVIHFPSSEYFSNVFSSIPLIMHEVSHTHHYGKTERRNRAVVYNINRFMAKKVANLLLSSVSDGIMVGTSDLLAEELTGSIFKAIVQKQKEFFGETEEFGEWKFQHLQYCCKEFYNSVLGISVEDRKINYNQFVKLKNRIRNDVDHLADVFGFKSICSAFSKNDDSCPRGMYYLINVLYLEFHPDFYHAYKDDYEKVFLRNLEKAARSENDDESEKIMLEFSLYRFVKYVMQDDSVITKEFLKSIEEKSEDYLFVSFSVVIVAGMWIVFERYREKFNEEVTEDCFYKNLLPRIHVDYISTFASRLTGAYAEFTERNDVSAYDRSLMEDMLYDYFELYVSTNNVIQYLADDSILQNRKMQNFAEEFISSIHDECRDYIKKEEENGLFKAVFAKSNRGRLVKLGFFEERSTILKDVFESVFSKNNAGFIDDIIEDRCCLFQEVYADCGMCCAMKFNMFGYLRLAVSNHNIASEFQDTIKIDDFLADRLRAVVRMYFDESRKEEWPVLYMEFLKRLFDIDMVLSICDMLSSIDKVDEVQEIKEKVSREEFLFRVDMDRDYCELDEILKQSPMKGDFFAWRDQALGALIGIIDRHYESKSFSEQEKDQIFAAKEYLIHVYDVVNLLIEGDVLAFLSDDIYDGYFQEIWHYMEQNRGIKAVQQEACVKEISRFYNMDCPDDEKNKFAWYYHIYSNKFVTECNFIFDHYCEYRNAYYNLINGIKNSWNAGEVKPINQWFEMIDGYYLKEGN